MHFAKEDTHATNHTSSPSFPPYLDLAWFHPLAELAEGSVCFVHVVEHHKSLPGDVLTLQGFVYLLAQGRRIRHILVVLGDLPTQDHVAAVVQLGQWEWDVKTFTIQSHHLWCWQCNYRKKSQQQHLRIHTVCSTRALPVRLRYRWWHLRRCQSKHLSHRGSTLWASQGRPLGGSWRLQWSRGLPPKLCTSHQYRRSRPLSHNHRAGQSGHMKARRPFSVMFVSVVRLYLIPVIVSTCLQVSCIKKNQR